MTTTIMRVGMRGWFTAVMSVGALELASAQKFEPGYVVLSGGDTLRGEVENLFWNNTPTQVRFRPTANALATLYTSEQLQTVRLGEGRYFRRETVPLDRAAESRISFLHSGLTSEQHPEQLLTEVLVEGEATLLQVRLPGAPHYIVRRPGRPDLELTTYSYLRTTGQGPIVTVNNYRQQLQLYFGDCSWVMQALPGTSFTTADLTRLVQGYDERCAAVFSPSRVYDIQRSPPFRLSAGPLLGVGVGSSRLRWANSPSGPPLEPTTLDGLELANRVQPTFGAYLDILQPGRAWAVHLETTAGPVGTRWAHTVPGAGSVPTATVEWGGTVVSPRAGLRVFTKPGKIRAQLFGGLGLGFDQRIGRFRSTLRYGDGQPRHVVSNLTLAGQTDDFFRDPHKFLVYAEAGIRRGRLTLSVEARANASTHGLDPLTVSRADQVGNGVSYYESPAYDLLSWRSSVVLGWRLNNSHENR